MLIGHLYIFFEEMSIQVLCPFLNRLFFVCLLVVGLLSENSKTLEIIKGPATPTTVIQVNFTYEG